MYDFALIENFSSPISMRKWVNPSMRVAVFGDSSVVGDATITGRRGARFDCRREGWG